MHSWTIFGAQTNHGLTRAHKIHHNLNLGGSHHLPLHRILLIRHRGYTQMVFFLGLQVGSPKILQIGTLAILDAYNFLCRPPIETRSKAKL